MRKGVSKTMNLLWGLQANLSIIKTHWLYSWVSHSVKKNVGKEKKRKKEKKNHAALHVFEWCIHTGLNEVLLHILRPKYTTHTTYLITSLDNKNYKLYTHIKANGSFYLLIWKQKTTSKLSVSKKINKN